MANKIDVFSHKNVAFQVVKKLPVDFSGHISIKKVIKMGMKKYNF